MIIEVRGCNDSNKKICKKNIKSEMRKIFSAKMIIFMSEYKKNNKKKSHFPLGEIYRDDMRNKVLLYSDVSRKYKMGAKK